MSNETKALQGQAGLIVKDLAATSIKLRHQLNDPDTFSTRVMAQRNDIDALEESLSKSFVELPDGRKLVSWEYEALERFAKDNRKNVNQFLGNIFAIENGNVVVVSLDSMSIKDINALSGLTGLKNIGLSSNQILDITALSKLTNLQRLRLCSNYNQDLNSLSGLTALERLSLDRNKIQDISFLSGLTSLQSLELGHNRIQDISSLSGLTGLKYLDLRNNEIQDCSALSGLSALKTVYIMDNQVRYNEAAKKIITSLTERGVSVYV